MMIEAYKHYDGQAPELESERSMLKLSSSSMLSAAPELVRFGVVIWHRAMELEK
jgi:hypothetical protein